jgi:hypothetical protein
VTFTSQIRITIEYSFGVLALRRVSEIFHVLSVFGEQLLICTDEVKGGILYFGNNLYQQREYYKNIKVELTVPFV